MSEKESSAMKDDIRVNIHQRSSKVAVMLTEIFFCKNTDCSEWKMQRMESMITGTGAKLRKGTEKAVIG